jgi:hypothetical protein
MTVFNIYCDESRHTSDKADRYAVIGALQCPRDDKKALVHRIHSLQALYNAHGELGWKRVSPNRAEFYDKLLEIFLETPALNFRCIVVDRHNLDHEQYNDGSPELGFYKLYYQMLVHWLQPSQEYRLYLDWQQNASSSRFRDLKTILTRKLTGRAHVLSLEPVSSDNQPLVQLADLLIGAVGYAWNERDKAPGASKAKVALLRKLESGLKRSTLASGTPKGEVKFNIFDWQGRA